MSAPEFLETLREIESYGLVVVAADDAEIAEALRELAMAGGEEGD